MEHELVKANKDEYGLETVIVPKALWEAVRGENSPCMSCYNGVVYARDGLTEIQKSTGSPHEATHAMQQLGYEPYLRMLEEFQKHYLVSSDSGAAFFIAAMEHCHFDVDDVIVYPGDDAKTKLEKEKAGDKVFSEILATLYGYISNGLIAGDTYFLDDFDFREVVDDLSEVYDRMKSIHRGFGIWNKNRQGADSGMVDTEIDTDYLSAVERGDGATARRMAGAAAGPLPRRLWEGKSIPSRGMGQLPQRGRNAYQRYLAEYERGPGRNGREYIDALRRYDERQAQLQWEYARQFVATFGFVPDWAAERLEIPEEIAAAAEAELP